MMDSILNILLLGSALCWMESRAADKRAKIWQALSDISARIDKLEQQS